MIKDDELTAIPPSTPATPGCSCVAVEPWALEDGTTAAVTRALPTPPASLPRRIGAEFLGTFVLVFFSTATPVVNKTTGGAVGYLGLAVSSGLSIMVVVFSTAHISGAHVNPSVTVAFAAFHRFPWKHVPMYIGVQLAASICAGFAVAGIFHPTAISGGATVPGGSELQAFLMELITSFNLMFVITAVATDTRAIGELAGVALGATVALNVLVAGSTSGASMNPARTLGPAVAANKYDSLWVYFVAPTLGALVGAGIYSVVKLPGDDDRKQLVARRRSSRR